MEQNLAFTRARIRTRLLGTSGPSTPVVVRWLVQNPLTVDESGLTTDVSGRFGTITGLKPDPITGAFPDGSQSEVSGTIRAFWHQTGASIRLRQFTEIQVGDVIMDLDPDAMVSVYDGQPLASGVVSLDDIANQGVRFELNGQAYTQAEIGEELAQAWNVVVGGQPILRTMLLRKAT